MTLIGRRLRIFCTPSWDTLVMVVVMTMGFLAMPSMVERISCSLLLSKEIYGMFQSSQTFPHCCSIETSGATRREICPEKSKWHCAWNMIVSYLYVGLFQICLQFHISNLEYENLAESVTYSCPARQCCTTRPGSCHFLVMLLNWLIMTFWGAGVSILRYFGRNLPRKNSYF